MTTPGLFRRCALSIALAASLASGACVEADPTGIEPIDTAPLPVATSADLRVALDCVGSVQGGSVTCAPHAQAGDGLAAVIVGGQNTYVRLTSSNVGYDSGTEIFSFDVTVQNLLNESIGTPDGTTPDANGIQVFFASGPTVTSGTGTVGVANADGTGFFTASDQPYFTYNEVLDKDEVSGARNWQLSVPNTASTFNFLLFLETSVQYRLVINEVGVNPGGTILDANGEWFELYNAGSLRVDLQNLVIADSAASGRRPYHLISSSVVVLPGGYVVLGNTTNTTNNGGVTVDYAYGAALQLANSLDAVKVARVWGTDTLTIDRTQYSSPGVSAQNGISRELTNPALDNSNMDGSNWADALVTAVYGPGGRGTPKAQNSTFTP